MLELEFILYVLLGLGSIATGVLGGIVSSENRTYQICFVCLGVLMALCTAALGILNLNEKSDINRKAEEAQKMVEDAQIKEKMKWETFINPLRKLIDDGTRQKNSLAQFVGAGEEEDYAYQADHYWKWTKEGDKFVRNQCETQLSHFWYQPDAREPLLVPGGREGDELYSLYPAVTERKRPIAAEYDRKLKILTNMFNNPSVCPK